MRGPQNFVRLLVGGFGYFLSYTSRLLRAWVRPPIRVSKLRHARERQRKELGKCEGRKPHGELRAEAIALAKRLHRASPKTGKRMSLRKIAAALAKAGHLNERGQPFNPKSIVAMVAQKT